MSQADNVIALECVKRKRDQFAPMAIDFTWTNLEWCAQHMVIIRTALILVGKSEHELSSRMNLLDERVLLGLLDDLELTQSHLTACAEVVGCARARLLLVCEGVA